MLPTWEGWDAEFNVSCSWNILFSEMVTIVNKFYCSHSTYLYKCHWEKSGPSLRPLSPCLKLGRSWATHTSVTSKRVHLAFDPWYIQEYWRFLPRLLQSLKILSSVYATVFSFLIDSLNLGWPHNRIGVAKNLFEKVALANCSYRTYFG